MKIKHVMALLCGASAGIAHAGSWTVASTSGAPGNSANIAVSFAGEGQSRSAELVLSFDHGRLSLPVASGPLAGGANGGSCVRTSETEVRVVKFDTGTALPTSPTIYCNIPFTIRNPAAVGRAPIRPTAANCFTETTQYTPCTASGGAVTVTGSTSTTPASLPQRKVLYVLLSAAQGAPTVESIASIDFSSGTGGPPPLQALTVGSPTDAWPLLPVRAAGDFAAYLNQHPNTARAKLERYFVVEYSTTANLNSGKSAFASEQFVDAVFEPGVVEPAVPPNMPGDEWRAPKALPQPKDAANQYHLAADGVPLAWNRASGWGLLGFLDNGIRVSHPDLRSFTGANSQSGSYTGGNYLPVYAFDYGRNPIAIDTDIDEAAFSPITFANDPNCDTNGDGLLEPLDAGHGTHVASLAAGNPTNGDIVEGVCRHCGIAMVKISTPLCFRSTPSDPWRVYIGFPTNVIEPSFTLLGQIGVQSISMSFGIGNLSPQIGYCGSNPASPYCEMLTFANANDIVVIAASGNIRSNIAFPGNDPRVMAVGGLDEGLAFWDESPGNNTNCPYSDGRECGSNYSLSIIDPRQELTSPARTVRAAIYPQFNWNDRVGCGDSYGGGTATDGLGTCTGTSMSTPQITGIVGILRSINPLLPAGDPENASVYGVRDVLKETTDRAIASLGWDQRLGYGRPNADLAVRRVLGTVATDTVKNRVTPLFGLYSPTTKDYAVTAIPQTATALMRFSSAGYLTVPTAGEFIEGAVLPGYPYFPTEFVDPLPVARVRAYILTTEFSRDASYPALKPLYLLDRTRNWPSGCTTGTAGCNSSNRDFVLAGSTSELEAAVAAGYQFRGRQGFVYSTCGSEPGCLPVGSQKLYQKCKTSDDDCAVFLESERLAFESAGYTGTPAFASGVVLGYAYPAVDSDSDGLVDGMEYVIGTNPADNDSDNDSALDGAEFPQLGVSNSDPCVGPSVSCLVTPNTIFFNGFE